MDFVVKNNTVQLSQRKLEGLYKLGQITQWGRSYPIKFCE